MNAELDNIVNETLKGGEAGLFSWRIAALKIYLDNCPAFSAEGNRILRAFPKVFAEWAEEVEQGKRTWVARNVTQPDTWRDQMKQLTNALSTLVHSDADDRTVRTESYEIIFKLASLRPQTAPAC